MFVCCIHCISMTCGGMYNNLSYKYIAAMNWSLFLTKTVLPITSLTVISELRSTEMIKNKYKRTTFQYNLSFPVYSDRRKINMNRKLDFQGSINRILALFESSRNPLSYFTKRMQYQILSAVVFQTWLPYGTLLQFKSVSAYYQSVEQAGRKIRKKKRKKESHLHTKLL